MNNLKFRLYTVSSQDEQYPASNLVSPTSDGWVSQRCCTYPQQLTLQFFVPIRTRNMKITFHHYKIPQIVEVFVKCMKNQKYRKLGFIQPSDNSQSDYLHKQIKTIFFEFPCSFVKLIFHKNYKNQMNLFDQVGISEIAIAGEVLSANELKDMEYSEIDILESSQDEQEEEVSQRQVAMNKNTSKAQTNKNFQSLLFSDFFSKLQRVKNEAVEREDFQQASQIKNTISNFRQIESQIITLQNQKKIALEDEDYDKCHKLKNEILRKKQMAQYQINQFHEYLSNPNAQSRVSSVSKSYLTNKMQNEDHIIHSPSVMKEKSPQYVNDYQSQIVPALRKKKQNYEEEFPSASRINDSIDQSIQQSIVKKTGQIIENQQAGENIPFSFFEQYKDLQELDLKTRIKIQQHFDFIPEIQWRMAYSKKYWKAKADALKEVIQYPIEKKEHVVALFEFISITIEDKHTISAKYTLMLLERVIKANHVRFSYSHTPYYIQAILTTLINMMNETSQELRKLSISIYENLPQSCIIHLSTVVHTLIKHGQNKKSNPKLLPIKLTLMENLIKKYIDAEYYLDEIVKWAISFLDDPNQIVRNKSSQLLIQITSQFNNIQLIMKHLQQIKNQNVYNAFMTLLTNSSRDLVSLQTDRKREQTERSQVEEQFSRREVAMGKKRKFDGEPEDDRLRKIQQSPIPSPQKLRQSEEIELAYSQESLFPPDNSQSHDWFAKENQIKVMEKDEYENEDFCEYCFEELGAITYNEHLSYDCTAVVSCEYCRALIYLKEMTTHLLNQCEKGQFKECDRCNLAFEVTQINDHKAQNICKKKFMGWQKCQLCEEDVESDDKAWVDHSKVCKQRKERHKPITEYSDYS